MLDASCLTLTESQFRALRLPPGAPLLVHASLRQVGLGMDGAPAIYRVLSLYARSSGATAIMPAFSYQCEDPAAWVEPLLAPAEIASRQAVTPAFDAATTPVHPDIGFLAEYFRRQPGSMRSSHPVLSFAAIGPQAPAATGGQGLHFPLGSASPLSWLVERHGVVLLIGTGPASMTLLHLAETAAPVSYVRAARCRVRSAQGWTWYWGAPGDRRDFAKAAGLLAGATIARGRFGKAPVVVVDAAGLHQAVLARLSAEPDWLLCGDPRCPFCAAARRSLDGQSSEIVYGEEKAGEEAPAQPVVTQLGASPTVRAPRPSAP